MPGLSTTKAVTASPHSVSGSPSTATSPTAGCAAITSSTSFGMMLDAPERMTSFSRPDDGKPAVAVERADVAGVQPAVAQRLAGRLLVLPIAGHDIAALHQHFAGRPPCHRAVEPHAIGGKRPADRLHQPAAIAAGQLLRRQVAADRRLGHAVEHADARPDEIERALEHRRWNARAADIDRLELRHAIVRAADARSSARAASAPATCAWRRSRRSSRPADPHRSGRRARPSRRRTDATSGSPARSATAAARSGTPRRCAMSKPWMVFCATVMRLRCRSITALGAPVVPPLKFSVARSSPSPSGSGCSEDFSSSAS